MDVKVDHVCNVKSYECKIKTDIFLFWSDHLIKHILQDLSFYVEPNTKSIQVLIFFLVFISDSQIRVLEWLSVAWPVNLAILMLQVNGDSIRKRHMGMEFEV